MDQAQIETIVQAVMAELKKEGGGASAITAASPPSRPQPVN